MHARTFYFASHFLERRKRGACYAVYAFCRYVDDLADEWSEREITGSISPEESTRRAIAAWSDDLDRVYRGEMVDDPVMIAWADVLERYEIPRNLPDELIEGCLSDLRPHVRYATFAELREYCYKVASVVGLMTSRIFGLEDPAQQEFADARAIDLGIAMQLTNILRDVGEDAADDRIYLPLDEIAAAGLEEGDILAGRWTPAFRDFMIEQIARARDYYTTAEEGILLLSKESRRTVRLMSRNYAGILQAIERNDYDVFTRRARVPGWKKLASLIS